MAAAHDAFISYSHAADGRLAPALERGLEKLACPLLKLRAIDVFRDETSLAANPELWTGIVEHLKGTRWFLLMASPESAASQWCKREIHWWLDHAGIGRMLVVLTDGEIAWDAETGDFDWSRTTALPQSLAGRLGQEPLYVDLRWARAEQKLSLSDSRFRGAILDLAAPIRSVPKDQLDGEDVRQLRRNRLLVRGLVSAITAAGGVAVWQAWEANQQRLVAEEQRAVAVAQRVVAEENARRAEVQRAEAEFAGADADNQRVAALAEQAEAERQRDEAQRQRDLAEARQLAAQAELARGRSAQDLERSAELAVASLQRQQTPEGLRALVGALELMLEPPQRIGTLNPRGRSAPAALSADGSAAVAISGDTLDVLATGDARPTRYTCAECAGAAGAAVSAGAGRVAVARGGHVAVLERAGDAYAHVATCTLGPDTQPVTSLALAPSGQLLVAIANARGGVAGRFWRLSSAEGCIPLQEEYNPRLDEIDLVRFSADSRLVGFAGRLRDRSGRMDIAVRIAEVTLRPGDRALDIADRGEIRMRTGGEVSALAVAGTVTSDLRAALATGGSVHVFAADPTGDLPEVARMTADAVALALHDGALIAAKRMRDAAIVVDTRPAIGNRALRRFRVVPGDVTVVVEKGGRAARVSRWEQDERLTRIVDRPVGERDAVHPPIPSGREFRPSLSPGGEFVAVAEPQPNGSSLILRVARSATGEAVWQIPSPRPGPAPVALAVSSDGTRLAVADGRQVRIHNRDRRAAQVVKVPAEVAGIKFLRLDGPGEVLVACTTTRLDDRRIRKQWWALPTDGRSPRTIHATEAAPDSPCVFGGAGRHLVVARDDMASVVDLATGEAILHINHENRVLALDAGNDSLHIASVSGDAKGRFCLGAGCDYRGRLMLASPQQLLAAARALLPDPAADARSRRAREEPRVPAAAEER